MISFDCSTKKYPNTIAIVDDDDFKSISGWKWRRNRDGYIVRTSKNKTILLHRQLLSANDGDIIDHINGKPYDNRRGNLRFCSKYENSWNQRPRVTKKTSSFKGVHFVTKKNRFEAGLCFNGNKIKLGRFKNEIDAAIAYNNAAKNLFGDFAFINEL